jgi:Transposase DDE domain group 1
VKNKLHKKSRARKRQKRLQRQNTNRRRHRILRKKLDARKRSVLRRLAKAKLPDFSKPIFRGCGNFRFDLNSRINGSTYGGIPLLHKLAQDIGLVDAINRGLPVFKIRLPYFESDHVLNIALNPLCNGTCLQDIEQRRNDPAFLDALGADRIPDPTTAGDFCRRFTPAHINALQNIFDDVRIGLWKQQPASFFEQAIIDADGTHAETTGECKQGMDISYDGLWCYHPLLLSLANTREVMRIVNRSGNRPSHEGAADAFDRVISTCFRGGFLSVLLRGDTDFSQTAHLDRWNADARIRFVFGYNCMPNLENLAAQLSTECWTKLNRPPRYTVETQPRHKPDNVKQQIVIERGYEVQRLKYEDVAEFDYQPTACKQTYRMIVVRKNISKEKGGVWLYDKYRYFFYITNDRTSTPEEIVFLANDRCHQENLIEQLKNGPRALKAPLKTLDSNWAYMVMTALAWNLKAWAALRLPETGRWKAKARAEKLWLLGMEFKAFVNVMVAIPCQMVRQARGVVFRILNHHPNHSTFLRLAEILNC